MTPPPSFDLAWLIALAQTAGDIGLRHFRQTTAERKADKTIVTAADREIEHLLVNELRHHYPQDGILGEEGSHHRATAERVWVLDPIDGTLSFANGLPVWCVCIGLLVAAQPVAGIIYLPATSDCFAAGLEGPALLNGRPITVAPPAPLDAETTFFGVSDHHRHWHTDFPGKIRNYGSCAAHICYVAQGSGIGAANTHTAIWDIAAALPILERAGGQATLLDGSPVPLAAMMDGSKIHHPVIAASSHHLSDLRHRFHYTP